MGWWVGVVVVGCPAHIFVTRVQVEFECDNSFFRNFVDIKRILYKMLFLGDNKVTFQFENET